MNQDLNVIIEKLDQLETRMNKRFDEMDKRFDTTDEQILINTEGIDIVARNLTEFREFTTNRLNGERRIDNLAETRAKVEVLSNLQQRVATLEEKVSI